MIYVGESPDEAYVRVLFAERYGLTLRKLPESTESGVPTPDYELFADSERCAVLEVKHFECTPRTLANGWRRVGDHGWTREDNAPSRVAARIHHAYGQLSTFGDDPKVLVFVNDEPLMDYKDLTEAISGFHVYENDVFGYVNTASVKIAEGRIRDERWKIDLYVWIDRHRGGSTWFRFTTDAGHALAYRRFGGEP